MNKLRSESILLHQLFVFSDRYLLVFVVALRASKRGLRKLGADDCSVRFGFSACFNTNLTAKRAVGPLKSLVMSGLAKIVVHRVPKGEVFG